MESKIKQIQIKAWEEMQSPRYWFRCHYNLPPTDPRYLDASDDEILIDFYAYTLSERYKRLVQEGAKDITLETLLIEEAFDEQLTQLKQEAEEAEKLIDFHAKNHHA